jgi:uncharacterized protein (DUF305 family)
MTVREPAAYTSRPRRRDGNDDDLHYLEETRAALRPAMALSFAAASSESRGHQVRALARDALTTQTRQLAEVSDCLLAWDRTEVAVAAPAETGTARDFQGEATDRDFADQLRTHSHLSIAAARAEMVTGASHRVRQIAEDAIRSHYRQLAALAKDLT